MDAIRQCCLVLTLEIRRGHDVAPAEIIHVDNPVPSQAREGAATNRGSSGSVTETGAKWNANEILIEVIAFIFQRGGS